MQKVAKVVLITCGVLFVLVIIIGSLGSNSKKDSDAAPTSSVQDRLNAASATKAPTDAPKATPTPVDDGKPEEEKLLRARIKEQYDKTDITDFKLNDNLGTEAEGDYIALVYLTWNVKNSEANSKDMLKLYSDDLAAYAAENCPTVQEIAIFWKVPYLSKNAKYSYERKSGAMYVADEIWTNY